MYELMQVGEKSYYIQSPAKIGIYRSSETEVYLIDSGSDKDAGRRCRKVLDEQGWTCRGILVTHSNADHVGGCAYLQKQYGCKIFSGGIEGAITMYPVLEPAFLYGGYPFKELRHKFLMAQPSVTVPFTDPDFPKEVEILPLPGHFFDMVGFRLPDGTVFLADCLSSDASLEKYQISFLYDVTAYLKTLEQVAQMEAAMFVPSHAEATADIAPLAERNRDKVLEIAEHICALCGDGLLFEELLEHLFDDYGLVMSYEQYVLIGSTVRSYLAWLKDSGRMEAAIEGSRIVWRTAK
ncbi:MAG: MBL fold metallo-hydrolase [Clostridiales bacterium]|nr:MBL fold metallo-hydrolase [Candidatus Cacconaster stercorequi]